MNEIRIKYIQVNEINSNIKMNSNIYKYPIKNMMIKEISCNCITPMEIKKFKILCECKWPVDYIHTR